ncbi:MAG: FAD-binding protein [Bacilli bacterium]
MEHYNIVIIGLGPAGSILASGLKNTYSILAIDKKNPTVFDGGFSKACGGLLAPDAQKALAELALVVPKSVIVDPQIFSVKTIDFDNHLTKYYQRMYININRHAFDLWLMKSIPDHVNKAFDCTVIKVNINADGKYTIDYRNKQNIVVTCSADIVIGADGASSIVRRYLYPKATYRYYTAIQQWFINPDKKPIYSCIFDSKITDCYSWTVSKDDYLLFGGAYPSKLSRMLFERQKEKLLSTNTFALSKPVKTEACLVMRPKLLKHFFLGKNNAFLVGEAAGFVSPSSLEGISYAINSAVALTNVLNAQHLDFNKKYRQLTKKMRWTLYLKNIKSMFIYNPFLRKLIMKSGIQSIKVKDVS